MTKTNIQWIAVPDQLGDRLPRNDAISLPPKKTYSPKGPTMSLNDIALCSRALIRLGAQPITSFTDGSAESEICGALYPQARDALLSAYGWGFATAQAELQQLSETPVGGYKYAYALPNDFLRGLAAGTDARDTSLDYRILRGKLYCNSASVFLTYIFRADESEFPSFFQTALIMRLAAELCIPLTENTSRFGTMQQIAESEFSKARQIDAQQDKPQRIKNFPLTDVRG